MTATYAKQTCMVCDSTLDPYCGDEYTLRSWHYRSCPLGLRDGCSKEKTGGEISGVVKAKGAKQSN